MSTAMAECFDEVRNQIKAVCRDFQKKARWLPWAELMSEAQLAFCVAYHSYDPSYDMTFSSWIQEKVWYRLEELNRQWFKWYRRNSGQDMDTYSKKDYGYLSSDANRVIRIVLRLSLKSKRKLLRSDNPRQTLFQMLLRKKRWQGKPRRLTRIFKELCEII